MVRPLFTNRYLALARGPRLRPEAEGRVQSRPLRDPGRHHLPRRRRPDQSCRRERARKLPGAWRAPAPPSARPQRARTRPPTRTAAHNPAGTGPHRTALAIRRPVWSNLVHLVKTIRDHRRRRRPADCWPSSAAAGAASSPACPPSDSAAAAAAASSAETSASDAEASAALARAKVPAAGTVANAAGENQTTPTPSVSVAEQAQAAGDEAPQELRNKVNAAKGNAVLTGLSTDSNRNLTVSAFRARLSSTASMASVSLAGPTVPTAMSSEK